MKSKPETSESVDSRVDQICDEFEAVFLEGGSPQIEQFLTRTDDRHCELLLRELVKVELEYRQERGEAVSEEDYFERFPDHREAIVYVFAQERSKTDSKSTEFKPPVIPPPLPPTSRQRVKGTGKEDLREPVIRTLDEYELLEELGAGGMGVVYRARHRRLDKTVAVKVLPTHRLKDPDALTRFEREMRHAGQVDHPNIVETQDAGQSGDDIYLVMKLVEGEDLQEVVERNGPLSIAGACEIARQTVLALEHLEQHGMVHRDVKPRNLMLTPDGTVKLLDLGLARLFGEDGHEMAESLTHTGSTLGTPDYIAPEQISDATDVDGRADLYSLGCTLFFLLTGQAPFEEHRDTLDKLLAHRSQPPPALRDAHPDASEAIAGLVGRLLEKSPENRPASAGEVVRALPPFCGESDLPRLFSSEVSPTAETLRKPSPQGIYSDPIKSENASTNRMLKDRRYRPAWTERRNAALVLLAAMLLVTTIGWALSRFHFEPTGSLKVTDEDKPEPKTVVPPPAPQPTEDEDRQEFLDEMAFNLETLDAGISMVEIITAFSTGELRVQLSKRLADLKSRRARLREEFAELERSSGASWLKTKSEMEGHWQAALRSVHESMPQPSPYPGRQRSTSKEVRGAEIDDVPWMNKKKLPTSQPPVKLAALDFDASGNWVGVYYVYPNFVSVALDLRPVVGKPDAWSGSAIFRPLRNLRDGTPDPSTLRAGVADAEWSETASVMTVTVRDWTIERKEPNARAYEFDGVVALVPDRFAGDVYLVQSLSGGLGSRKPHAGFLFVRKGKEGTRLIDDARRLTNLQPISVRDEDVELLVQEGLYSVCEKWAARFKNEYPNVRVNHTVYGKLHEMSANLFTDEHFQKYFGVPFDEMDDDTSATIGRAIAYAANGQRGADLREQFYDLGAFGRHFGSTGSSGRADTIAKVWPRREILRWRDQRLVWAASVARHPDSEARLRQLDAAFYKRMARLFPSETASAKEQIQQLLAGTDATKKHTDQTTSSEPTRDKSKWGGRLGGTFPTDKPRRDFGGGGFGGGGFLRDPATGEEERERNRDRGFGGPPSNESNVEELLKRFRGFGGRTATSK